MRISFWGPSCSASLSDESSPGPAETAAAVTAALAPVAAPPAAPGGWCWPPAPAILSTSCGDTAPPGGGGGGGQAVRSVPAVPGAPRPAAAIFRSPSRPRGEGSPGTGRPPQGPPGSFARLRRQRRARRGTKDANHGPPGTPAHPTSGCYRARTQNRAARVEKTGVKGDRESLPLPLGPGVPGMGGRAGRSHGQPPQEWQRRCFLPGFMGAGVRTAPGVEREPRASSRLPWAHPATFWNQNPEKLGPCSQFPLNKSPLCP